MFAKRLFGEIDGWEDDSRGVERASFFVEELMRSLTSWSMKVQLAIWIVGFLIGWCGGHGPCAFSVLRFHP
jgi:hypothetical protein